MKSKIVMDCITFADVGDAYKLGIPLSRLLRKMSCGHVEFGVHGAKLQSLSSCEASDLAQCFCRNKTLEVRSVCKFGEFELVAENLYGVSLEASFNPQSFVRAIFRFDGSIMTEATDALVAFVKEVSVDWNAFYSLLTSEASYQTPSFKSAPPALPWLSIYGGGAAKGIRLDKMEFMEGLDVSEINGGLVAVQCLCGLNEYDHTWTLSRRLDASSKVLNEDKILSAFAQLQRPETKTAAWLSSRFKSAMDIMSGRGRRR